jgi:hypothetical protein
MLIHFSYNLSVIIIGNASVNGYENYSSAFTSTFIDRIIIPAAYYTAVRTASAAPNFSAWASAAPTATDVDVYNSTASASTALTAALVHQHNNTKQ